MTTRRTFIKTLAALPPALSFRRSWAANPATDPSRLALIIGNSSYRDAPLVNPVNDAKAVGTLFTQAGFTVDSQLNATRVDMITAIERFGVAAKRPETKLVVFYYAGHGAQLEWRNYLLPVDAVVQKQEDMKQRCVDLSLLLGQLSETKGKTFIIILDACRNNPFGSAYRPEQKGLSQFDAPVGSLLAYATSPGNVASDGAGENGLYTENLVRELSNRNIRIEDALKRVRLNVRLASNGQQIPWETTSLEGDVFIFNEGQKKLSEAEQEKLVEADVTEWTRIKSSKQVEDWVNYLRTFPNGRFAEIAQMRLARLLPKTEESKPVPVQPAVQATPQSTAATAAPASGPASMINIGAGLVVPTLMAPSANPNSAGRYPLARVYVVGDEATERISDILTGVEERTFTTRVTRVDYDADRVEFDNGSTFIVDLMGNPLKSGPREFDYPIQLFPAELQLGKKWTAAFRVTMQGKTSNAYYDVQIVKRETISVPAGSFDTFRIEAEGWNNNFGLKLEYKAWVVPGLIVAVKSENIIRNQGRFIRSERRELIALRQHSIDAK